MPEARQTGLDFLIPDDHRTPLRLTRGSIALPVRTLFRTLFEEQRLKTDPPNLAFFISRPRACRQNAHDASQFHGHWSQDLSQGAVRRPRRVPFNCASCRAGRFFSAGKGGLSWNPAIDYGSPARPSAGWFPLAPPAQPGDHNVRRR